jgi:acetone carboxylase gamma subunit
MSRTTAFADFSCGDKIVKNYITVRRLFICHSYNDSKLILCRVGHTVSDDRDTLAICTTYLTSSTALNVQLRLSLTLSIKIHDQLHW